MSVWVACDNDLAMRDYLQFSSKITYTHSLSCISDDIPILIICFERFIAPTPYANLSLALL